MFEISFYLEQVALVSANFTGEREMWDFTARSSYRHTHSVCIYTF